MLNLAKPEYLLMMQNWLCRFICFFTSLQFCIFRFMHKSSTKWKGAYLTEAPSRLLPYIFCYLVSAFQITLMQRDRVNNGSRKIRKRNAEADQAKCIVISWSLEIYIIEAQFQCLELILCHEFRIKRYTLQWIVLIYVKISSIILIISYTYIVTVWLWKVTLEYQVRILNVSMALISFGFYPPYANNSKLINVGKP